jgi:dCTP deaminase
MNDLPRSLSGQLLEKSDDEGEQSARSTGVLPWQELHRMVHTKELQAREPILEDQFQPASVDLRLGPMAYRVRASFLPGPNATVHDKLRHLSMHEMDITQGGVLERGCVYIIPLLESVYLKSRTSAIGNPKSSTGRLDIFTRLITDNGTEFDRVREGYKGQLYAEVSPRTFSVLVRKGSRLNQLRIRRGNPLSSDEKLRRLHKEHELVESMSEEDIKDGVLVRVDVQGEATGGIIGYKARSHAGLIDVDRKQAYDASEFWEPIVAPTRGGLVLDPAEFYILASQRSVKVPSAYAAEMIAYDTLVGEFRVHYAGFFDPGFGDSDTGGAQSRAVLEVRSYEVPFVIEHGQVVGRLVYEPLTAIPTKLYGQGVGSSYQGQGIALSKHFRMPHQTPLPCPQRE